MQAGLASTVNHTARQQSAQARGILVTARERAAAAEAAHLGLQGRALGEGGQERRANRKGNDGGERSIQSEKWGKKGGGGGHGVCWETYEAFALVVLALLHDDLALE